MLFVVVVVGLGLAIRFTLNRRKAEPAAPAPVKTPIPPVVEHVPPAKREPPPPAEKPAPPVPVEPEPRIKGATLVSSATVQWFAPGPGVVYYCEDGQVMAAPKSGGTPRIVGDCKSAFDFVADADGVMYCDDDKLKRITAGTEGSHVVVEGIDCIMMAVDSKYAYYVLPGYDDVDNPGVYRVSRTGGTPERIHATRPKEQFGIVNDGAQIWISAWSAGTIAKLPKTPNAKPTTVIANQKGLVDFDVDDTYLYWYVEGSGVVRRRKKVGGPIEVVGHDVDQEPIVVADGHAYWFETGPGPNKRLVHLAPGAKQTEVLAIDLHAPSLRADAEGVYVSELDREGIFMFKR